MIPGSLLARKLKNVREILEKNGIEYEIKLTVQPRGSEDISDGSRVLRVTKKSDGSFLIIAGNSQVNVYNKIKQTDVEI